MNDKNTTENKNNIAILKLVPDAESQVHGKKWLRGNYPGHLNVWWQQFQVLNPATTFQNLFSHASPLAAEMWAKMWYVKLGCH